MNRLHFFNQHPHTSIHEQKQNEKPVSNAHGQESDDTSDCSANGCSDDEASYNQVPNKGILDREIKVCNPDCAEYFVNVGDSTFMLRVNTETNLCRLVVRLKGREFSLDEIYEAIPELPIMFGGEVNNELRDRLQKDGFVLPGTPYELGDVVTPKDEVAESE
jgi:hypothetical protein